MTLDPGFYKLEKGTSPFNTWHYLRVYVKDGQKYYQIDHSLPIEVDKQTASYMHDEGYKILSKISQNNPPQYTKIIAKVEFEDEEGARYKFIARSGTVLEYIFKQFPRLKKRFWS